MRISVKGRYALAAMLRLGQAGAGSLLNVNKLAGSLGISRIYLEQVFALLKQAGLVLSTKGAQGGYRLAQTPAHLSVRDILAATDPVLFEQAGPTLDPSAQDAEAALQLVNQKLDSTISACLSQLTLSDLLECAAQHNEEYMFYI